MAKGGKRPGAGRKTGSTTVAKKELRELFADVEPVALATIRRLCASDNDRIALDASMYVIDQLRGKPRQRVDVGGTDTPVQHKVEIEIVRRA